jgi:ribonuclease HI
VKAAQCIVQRGTLSEPGIAEALAAVQTVNLCRDLGLSKIQLEGDAKNVVKALNSKWKQNWSKGGHIIEDARFIMKFFFVL